MQLKNRNIAFAILLSLLNISIFLILQVLATALPILLYLFFAKWWSSVNREEVSPISGFSIASATVSALVFVNFLKSIREAISTPEESDGTKNQEILQLIQSVVSSLEIPPFKAVFLNSELDISTSYVGQYRYLNLSTFALIYLTEEELKGVIAHECAHHHNNAMLVNRVYNRTYILFNAYENSLINAISSFERLHSKNFLCAYTLGFASVFIFKMTLLPCLLLYRIFLNRMGSLVNNIDYEYYCDFIAAKLVGGNIFALALQKIFDLHIASKNIGEEDIPKNCEKFTAELIGKLYLESLRYKFNNIRYFNPSYRVSATQSQTQTHPSIISRIERIQDRFQKEDLSQPLFSEIDVSYLMKDLGKSPYFKIFEKVYKNKRKSDALNEVPGMLGNRSAVIINRDNKELDEYGDVQVFIDGIDFGVMKSDRDVFELESGVHVVCISSSDGWFKSDDLELVLLDKEIELECCFVNNSLTLNERYDK